jgi:hypothetical protein
MDQSKTTYDYPTGAEHGMTEATLVDGRKMTIHLQYARIYPHGEATLDGIDTEALVADARLRGLCGPRPRTIEVEDARPVKRHAELCPRCNTYCYGDCRSH